MRCFIALEVPDDLKEYYSKKLSSAKHSFSGNIVKGAQMHITLFFFGNIDNEQVNNLSVKLKQISDYDPFDVKLGRGKFFSKNGTPFTAYVEVISEGLKQLRDRLLPSVKEFLGDNRPFIPHLTLLRIKKISDTGIFNDFLNSLQENIYQAETVKLIKSDLRYNGPVYTVLKEFSLKNKE